VAKELWFAMQLVLFMITHYANVDGCSIAIFDNLKWVLAAFATMTLSMGVFMVVRQFYYNKCTYIVLPILKWRIGVPRTLTSTWSQLRNISMLLLLISYLMPPEPCAIPCSSIQPLTSDLQEMWHLANSTGCGLPRALTGLLEDMPELNPVLVFVDGVKSTDPGAPPILRPSERGGRRLEALAMLFMWIQMLQTSIISKAMAAFSYSVSSMFKDLLRTLFLILVLLMAFGSALSILDEDEPFNSGFDVTVVRLLEEVLGVAQPTYADVSSRTRCLLLLFVALVTVVMLNILIAQLTITYERVISNMEAHAIKHRGSLCLDMEDFLPLSWRKRIFGSYGFEHLLPFEGPSDLGPAGGIQVYEDDNNEYYIPDRIFRFTGDAAPKDPWPDIDAEF